MAIILWLCLQLGLLLLAIIDWLCLQLGLRWVPCRLCSPLFAGFLVQDVENIVALPNEAAEAEEMLKDETQLLQVMLAGFVSCTEAEDVCLLQTDNAAALSMLSAGCITCLAPHGDVPTGVLRCADVA